MSQSSIATSLSAGVSVLGGTGEATGGAEKRLSFVDPELRAVPLAKLSAAKACAVGLTGAGGAASISGGEVVASEPGGVASQCRMGSSMS